ncbi:F-box/kelch-repeat protein At1g57790-like [Primulina huaijiensis]|uniref:F-box/kelch-repeat protein At1g57790-like n=1 Tax=Primulina huaijiensis TaxID=1492673 RepID=UPI003CC72688
MARGRKRMKLLADTIKKERRDSSVDSDEEQTWSALPIELLEQFLSQLNLKDNIRASAVCKRWLAVAISVRQANKPPWLMYMPKHGDLYEFYDPSERKKYWLKFPELQDSRLCYAKDGWLLMMTPRPLNMFFFCPYTREVIKLPVLRRLALHMIAFSAAPTSPSCVLFTVRRVVGSIVEIRTCRPGDKEWTTINYESHPTFDCGMFDKIVFSKGHFCCLCNSSFLGLYNPSRSSWTVHHVPLPERPLNSSSKSWYSRKFMAEHGGDVYLVNSSSHDDPLIFKLDETNMAWIRIQTLGNTSLFVSFFSSHAVMDLLGTMRNSVYFPKVLYYGKRCVQYSLAEERFFPRKKLNDWEENDTFNRIWIEAPEDLSFLYERGDSGIIT